VIYDLDGTLCNSLNETMIHSYLALFPDTNAEGIQAGQRRRFLAHRHLIFRPTEFYGLWHCIRSGRPLDRQAILRRLRTAGTKEKKIFYQRFLRLRGTLMTKSARKFASLNPLYPGVRRHFLGRKGKAVKKILLTLKDRKSTYCLVRQHGLQFEKIYTGEDFNTKKDALRKIQGDREGSGFLVLDDQEKHLREAKSLGMRAAWASWGFGRRPAGSWWRPGSFADLEKAW